MQRYASSGARLAGGREEDSELDVLILTGTRLSRHEEAVVADAIYALELTRRVALSTLLYAKEEWDAPLTRVTRFRVRVEAEAVLA